MLELIFTLLCWMWAASAAFIVLIIAEKIFLHFKPQRRKERRMATHREHL